MKKLSLIICLLLTFVSVAPASFANEVTLSAFPAEESALLSALDINISPVAETVTRSEFALFLSKTAGKLVNTSIGSSSPFSDVNGKTDSGAAVIGVCGASLMNGVGDGKFNPNGQITSQDAVVALVRLAGYETAALYRGGYPSGYLAVAAKEGITKGVSVGAQPLDGLTLSTLIYNTLHTDVYQLVGMGETVSFEAHDGEDVLYIYHDIHSVDGTVTANRFTSNAAVATLCKPDEIEIDKTRYKYSDKSMEDMIGMAVTAYYRQSSADAMGTVIAMYEDYSVNRTLTLGYKDIDSADGFVVEYTDGDKTRKASIERGFSYIYNGKYWQEGTVADFMCEDSTLTLIDSDGNGDYETAVQKAGQTMIVTGIDRTEYIIYGENQMSVNFDDTDDANSLDITDSDGEEVYFDRIKNGNVLTVFASKDMGCVKITLSTDTVSGKISTVDTEENTVTFADSEGVYYIAPGFEKDFVLGLEGEFYLDAFGRLVYSDTEPGGDFEYGYFISGAFDSPMLPPRLRLLTSVEVEVFNCADDFFIDGKKVTLTKGTPCTLYDGTVFIPQIVRYKCDAKGNIRYIDTVEKGSGNEAYDKLTLSKTVSAKYNEEFPNFANTCVIGGNTFFAKAPTDAALLFDEDYYSNDKNIFAADKTYTVTAYDMDDTLTAGAIVYNSNTITVSGKIDDYSSSGIVLKKYQCLDKNGDARDALKIFTTSGAEKTVYFDDKYSVSKDMELGDIILYTLDAEGCIMSLAFDFDYSEGDVSSNVSSYSSYFTKYVGYPYAKSDGCFSFLNIRNNDTLNESWEHLLAFPTTVMKFIEVDMSNGTAVLSSYEYVESYKHFSNPSNKSFVKVYRGGGHYMDYMVTYKN